MGSALLAAPRLAQENPAEPPQLGAVRLGTWYALGPFDNPKGADVTQDPGVEKWLRRMKVGEPWSALQETFPGHGKTKLAWRAVPADRNRAADAGPFDTGTLDLRVLLDANGAAGDNTSAYLYCTLEAEQARVLELVCGSDDGLRLWLDGELLIDKGVLRGLRPYDESLSLKLAPGLNHLLVKITNAGGAWAFAMLEPRHATKDDINRAIDRGVARLLELQLIDGSWGERQDDYPNGQTGLSVYTLQKCGVSTHHAAILQAVESIRARTGEKTYSTACQILAVSALHDPAQREWLQGQVERILGWQDKNGGWSYPNVPTNYTDLSNTHLAAFSLRAAAQNGIEIPATVWNDIAAYTLRSQESRRKGDGAAGFVYFPGHETGYTGSMTTAGLALLALTREALGTRMLPNVRLQVEPAIEAGLGWLVRNWSVSKNPNKGDWHLYYLYALERVGSLLQLDKIGPHAWYSEGADVLVPMQDAEGGWGAQAETCFALLFLRRATAQPLSQETPDGGSLFATSEGDGPLRLRAKAGTPAALWIDAPRLDRGVTVAHVDFFVRYVGEDWRTLSSAEGELALRQSLERPGAYEVRAEAVLSDESRLVSSTLSVLQEEGLGPEQREYARDALRNRLPELKPVVRCSSELEPAVHIADNRIWTRWLCKETDGDPWIEIDPAKTVGISQLVLTHARTTGAESRHANPRPTRVELFLNKEKAARLVEIDPDPRKKTTIEFSPPVSLSRLKLRIVALEGGVLGKAAVGFSELEARAPGQ